MATTRSYLDEVLSSLPTTKRCTKCGVEKDRREFYKDSRAKDGLQSHCRICYNASRKKYQERNRERKYIANPATKVCPNCQVEKSSRQFWENKGRKDGLSSWCRMCGNASKKKYQERNRERKHVAIQDTKVCPRCQEKKKSSDFAKTKRNKDGLSGWCRICKNKQDARRNAKYRNREIIDIPSEKKCGDCGKTKPSTCFYQNKSSHDGLYGYCKDCNSQRVQKRRHEIGRVYRKNIPILIQIHGISCYLCGKDLERNEMEVDHVHPVSKKDSYDGDINSIENLRIACMPCNRSKKDKMLPDDFDLSYPATQLRMEI